MVKCRFDMKTHILGLDITHYKWIKLGDKYAKLIKHTLDNGEHRIKLLSRHKKNDFIMEVESIWTLEEGKKTFNIVHCVIEIELFDLVQQVFVVPDSHKNMLIDFFEML